MPNDNAPQKSIGLALAENVKADINVTVDFQQTLKQIGDALASQKADTNAVIYNYTDTEVQFYCYNDSDNIRALSARKPLCAPKTHALVDKGATGYGPTIQIWVDDKKGPYYVKRNHAYMYTGDAFLELIETEK